MTDWDNLMNPAREALEALIAKGDDMADHIAELEAKQADLVRAGYLAGVMDVQKIASDAEVFDVSDEAEYLAADPEAVAAIVAQVMEKE